MSVPPAAWPPPPEAPGPGGMPGSGGSAALILVLGILSVFGVLGFLGPVAWMMGNKALASGTLSADQASKVSAGRICGMIGTGLFVLGLLGSAALVGIFFLGGIAQYQH